MQDKYLITLGQITGFGPSTINRLHKHFGSYENIWRSTANELAVVGASSELIDKLTTFQQKTDPDYVVEQIQKNNIQVITLFDGNYPFLLKQIKQPPLILYLRGQSKCLDNQPAISVVGTRHFSSYGQKTLEKIIAELKSQIRLVVSGLAYGIDSIAHTSAIKNNVPTLAVVASGLDWPSFQPRGQRWLAEKIISEQGAIVSDFPLSSPVQKYNFPQRNRLIAGLTKVTVVIEAGEKSGALITARWAADYGREVLALPGDITRPQSLGCNQLISKGANVLLNADDVLKIFKLNTDLAPPINELNLTPLQEKIIGYLQTESALSIDELLAISGLSVNQLTIEVSTMELLNLVRHDLFGKITLN